MHLSKRIGGGIIEKSSMAEERGASAAVLAVYLSLGDHKGCSVSSC